LRCGLAALEQIALPSKTLANQINEGAHTAGILKIGVCDYPQFRCQFWWRAGQRSGEFRFEIAEITR